ncbi:MAG TPA: methionine--tRNA ligase subunit beta, partial [Chlamydiales bacterium]|nr:methionine--tRNA ligase subunit beta [Chlamydiales bacterium]
YVWFEAPIGYISATKEWAEISGKREKWKEYWCDPKTHLVQFVGKDNIPFHAAIFPAMTMGQNHPYKLVDELQANEFYNLEGRQFSKSDGWYVDLEEFLKNYSADMIRYMLAATAPETADSEFSWKEFQMRVNSELVGKFGNFIHRSLVFIQNNLQRNLPQAHTLEPSDEKFLADIGALSKEIGASFESCKLRRASQLLMEMAQVGNVYFDLKKPWQDAKSDATKERMETSLYCCIECVKLLAHSALPIIPETAEKIQQMITPQSGLLPVPQTLFRKIEDEEIEKEELKLQAAKAPKKTEPAAATKSEVTIDEVRKLELKVAKIVVAERVPKSQKLLRLEVEVGAERRQIMAGIAQSFQPETLLGKNVVIVANMKPAKLMGYDSQGMLLVGNSGDTMQLLEMTLPAGSSIS